jgi:hypothetical protein
MYTTSLSGLGAACTPQYLDYQCVGPCCPGATPTPTPPAPTAPVAQDPRVVCNNLFQHWIGKNPQYNACMTRADRDAIVNQCIAWQTKRTTLEAAEKKRIEILERACGATFRTACEKAYLAWASANPQLAACVNASGKETLIKLCIKAQSENWAQSKRTSEWNAAVKKVAVCPRPVPPAPPPPAPAPTAAPPPPPPPAPDPYVEPPSVIMAEPEPEPEPQTDSGFRKWGPVLGLGLLIAGGAYYIGKKPKPKRRAA